MDESYRPLRNDPATVGLLLCGECGYYLSSGKAGPYFKGLLCKSKDLASATRPNCSRGKYPSKKYAQAWIDQRLRERLDSGETDFFAE